VSPKKNHRAVWKRMVPKYLRNLGKGRARKAGVLLGRVKSQKKSKGYDERAARIVGNTPKSSGIFYNSTGGSKRGGDRKLFFGERGWVLGGRLNSTRQGDYGKEIVLHTLEAGIRNKSTLFKPGSLRISAHEDLANVRRGARAREGGESRGPV